jgi:RNA polymerase sigma factor (TIGR02999 family)
MSKVTHICFAIAAGDRRRAEQLLPPVYDELRKLAAQKLAQERPGQTLQTTALVHEAYLRLVNVDKAQHGNSRGHFFAAAAEATRQMLVEQAHRKRADKHRREVAVAERRAGCAAATAPEDLLAFDEALGRLTRHDPNAAQLVRLYCSAALTAEQAAEGLDVSRISVEFVDVCPCLAVRPIGRPPGSGFLIVGHFLRFLERALRTDKCGSRGANRRERQLREDAGDLSGGRGTSSAGGMGDLPGSGVCW